MVTTLLSALAAAEDPVPDDRLSRDEVTEVIEDEFPSALQGAERTVDVPEGTRVVSQGEQMRVLDELDANTAPVVSYGVFGHIDPETKEFTPASNRIERASDGSFRQKSSPFLMTMPARADGWFQFGADRDEPDEALVEYRLVGAQSVAGSTPSPTRVLYPNAILNEDGVTGDVFGGFDGRETYSDYLVLRDLQPTMRFEYELRLADGVHGIVDDLGGVSFSDGEGNLALRIAPPVANDSSDESRSVPASYQLEGDRLVLTVKADDQTVAPVLVDPEWEVLPHGVEYRCVEDFTPCDSSGDASDADDHVGNGDPYVEVDEVHELEYGMRSVRFPCNPPDDGREGSQYNQNEPRLDGDPRSIETCYNTFAYPRSEPWNSQYKVGKRWAVSARIPGPSSRNDAYWRSIGVTWCSGDVNQATAGVLLRGRPDAQGDFDAAVTLFPGSGEGRWVKSWANLNGGCRNGTESFPNDGSGHPRDNGVVGCEGGAPDPCQENRYNAAIDFDIATLAQQEDQDLYIGMFGDGQNLTSVQEFRMAVVERLWYDAANAQAENFRMNRLAADTDGYELADQGGVRWSNKSNPRFVVNLYDNLSGIRSMTSQYREVRNTSGAWTNNTDFDWFATAIPNEGADSIFQQDSAVVAPGRKGAFADGRYDVKVKPQDWAHSSGQDLAGANWNPYARNGGPQWPIDELNDQFVIDTSAPAIQWLTAADTDTAQATPNSTVNIRLNWAALGDYPGGDRNYFVSRGGTLVRVEPAPSTTWNDTTRAKDPCAAQTLNYSVAGQDNSPFFHVGGAATRAITVDHRANPGTPLNVRFVRGATGAIADWTDVAPVGTTPATCSTITYEYQWDDNANFSSPSPSATTWSTASTSQTALIPQDPCQPLFFRVRTLSGNGLRSTSTSVNDALADTRWTGNGVATTNGTVDCRPTIVRRDPAIGSTGMRFYNLADSLGVAYTSLQVRTADPVDGPDDLSQPNVEDGVNAATTTRHSARAFVRIEDNRTALVNEADADARITWTYVRIDSNIPSTEASVTLHEGATAAPRSDAPANTTSQCRPGENVRLVGRFWVLNCATLARTDIPDDGAMAGDQRAFDLTLPVRPTALAPDQVYDIDGCVHDRAQPADYRYLHNGANNVTDALTPAAGAPVDTDAACARIDLGDLTVDRTPPADTQPEFVRGATGARARWTAVLVDQNGNPDLSGVASYRWSGTDGEIAADDCAATIAQPAAAVATTWLETPLCKDDGIGAAGTDSVPGTTITFDVITVDVAGNLSTQANPPAIGTRPPASVSDTVDQRPRVFRVGSGPVRFYNLADQRAAAPRVYRDLDIRVTDPDNNEDRVTLAAGTDDADFFDAHRIDPAESVRPDATRISTIGAAARNAPRDYAQLVVTIDDPNDAQNDDDGGTSPDASARIIYTFGRTDTTGVASSPRQARVVLDELPYESVPFAAEDVPAGVDSCFPGENRTLQGRYWIVDCASLTEVAATDADGFRGVDISLPVRPTDGVPFVTPDQEYNVLAYVRDRAQEADYRHLVNATDNTTNAVSPAAVEPTVLNAAGDAVPNSDTNLQTRSRDMGELWVDRILPDGFIQFPDQDPTIVANPTVTFRSIAADVDPGSTLAPVSGRTITTDPITFEASGAARVQFVVFDRNVADGSNGAQRMAPTDALPCIDAAGNGLAVLYDTVVRQCDLTWNSNINTTTDLNVCQIVTDRAGNVYTTCRWLRIAGQDPEMCEEIDGQTPRLLIEDFAQDEIRDPAGYIDDAQYEVTNGNATGNGPETLHIQCSNGNIRWTGGIAFVEQHDIPADPNDRYQVTTVTAAVPSSGKDVEWTDEYQELFNIRTLGADGVQGTADDRRYRVAETQVRATITETVYQPGADKNDDPTIVSTATRDVWLRYRAWTTDGGSYADGAGYVRFHVFETGDDLQDDDTATWRGEGATAVECRQPNECNDELDLAGLPPS